MYQFDKSQQILPTSAISFLKSYLPQWRGENKESIFALIAALPIGPYEGNAFPPHPQYILTNSLAEYEGSIIEPLEAGLLDSTLESLSTLLSLYTTLLTHWTALLLSKNTPSNPAQTTTIQSLTTHTSLLSLTLLVHSPPTFPIISTVLTYLESLIPFLQAPLSIPLPPPSPILINLILFTNPSLTALSRISSLLAAYKHAFEPAPPTPHTPGTENPPSPPAPPPKPAEHIRDLNAELIDTCNLFFRSRAFNTNEAHTLGCLLPSSLHSPLSQYTASLDPPHSLPGLFSLSHHTCLAGLSETAFCEVEDAAAEKGENVAVRHAGPITQKALAQLGRRGGVEMGWKEYRVVVLRWLGAMGVTGFGELGVATMRGLMGGGRDSDVGLAQA